MVADLLWLAALAASVGVAQLLASWLCAGLGCVTRGGCLLSCFHCQMVHRWGGQVEHPEAYGGK